MSIALLGDFVREADPVALVKALLLVMDRRWDRNSKHNDGPGSEKWTLSTRKFRPQLVQEIEEEWCKLNGVSLDEDLFPYHESYVIRLWVALRKKGTHEKEQWIAAAKND